MGKKIIKKSEGLKMSYYRDVKMARLKVEELIRKSGKKGIDSATLALQVLRVHPVSEKCVTEYVKLLHDAGYINNSAGVIIWQ